MHEDEYRYDLTPLYKSIYPEGSTPESPYIGKNPEEKFSINPSDRRPINRPANTVAYEGKWYHQSLYPTCTAWTVANAGLALGLKPDMDSI